MTHQRKKIIDFVTRAVMEHRRHAGEALSITVPAPLASMPVFLATGPRDMSLLWEPYDGPHYAAWGVAQTIELAGRDRFEQLRRWSKDLWSRVRSRCFPGMKHYVPRIFGGFAFEPGHRDQAWQEFGDGVFVLPRWVYRCSEQEASLTLTICDEATSVIDELERILNALLDDAYLPARCEGQVRVEQLAYSEWECHVERIKRAIGEGTFQKIVAARLAKAHLQATPNDAEILAGMPATPGCIRFYMRRERSAYFGMSPERLFTKDGRALSTQALAGTAHQSEMLSLTASQKDREEHDYVVREIERALTPMAEEVVVASTPVVWRVGDIAHLRTEITAKLRADIGAVDALKALHPTPAVGGVPVNEANLWIVENEPFDRGWYTGCIGWLDQEENACFDVAIRSSLVIGNEALVFAGAGIVAASDARKEFDEAALKQIPMLRALGCYEG